MEDLPEAVFLQGGDPPTVQALQANLPDLSRPEVQAYIVRCAAVPFSITGSGQTMLRTEPGRMFGRPLKNAVQQSTYL